MSLLASSGGSPRPPSVWDLVADLLDPSAVLSRWFCDRPECDGEPHEGWHWCSHPLPHPQGGDEFRRCRHSRWEQRPPQGAWQIWLVLAGRGWGKTRTGAEWLAREAVRHPNTTWAAVAPTRDDLKSVCFEGESGLLEALQIDRSDERYNKSDLTLRVPNGSLIRGLSAERPERARGPNLDGAWLDEVSIWRYRAAFDDLLPALRHGQARVVATTTPRPVPLVMEWVGRKDGSVRVTRGSIWDNAANLSEAALQELRTRWEGTRMARQELFGELLEDVPGALWRQASIDANRILLEDDG